jgi:hypothetical protein
VNGRGRVLVVAALLATAAGCGRRTTLSTSGSDSTSAISSDSVAILARDVQAQWEGGSPEDGASLSAALLNAEFGRRPPEQWDDRAHALLDSLSIGAELASGPCIEVANFFARANPDGGSWPYLFWCGDKRPHSQEIDGRGLHLVAVATASMGAPAPVAIRIPFAPKPAPAAPKGAAAVAVLFAHRAGGGSQPLVMTWWHAHRDDPWMLAQTLGADSLGGVGTGEFTVGDTLTLVTRTYQPSRGFDECATCPHVYRTHRFRWRGQGFTRIEDQRVTSPYATFVLYIAALAANDHDAAMRYVTDPDLIDRANHLDWGRPKGSWRVAPETDETASHMVFFRGPSETYRVDFVQDGGDWKITNFEPTTRSIE